PKAYAGRKICNCCGHYRHAWRRRGFRARRAAKHAARREAGSVAEATGVRGAKSASTNSTSTKSASTNPQERPEDPLNAVLGTGEFSDADHNRLCPFPFRSEAASGGRRLDVDKSCVSLFPSTKNISRWALNNYGDLSLLDSHGTAVIELTQVESGMYDGFSPGEGRYVLQTAASAPVHLAEDMIGDWAITRGTGKPICMLTLANSPVNSPSGALTLRLKTGCDPLVTRFNPNAWRIDQGELVLLSPRGQSWQFVETDPGTW